MKINKNSWHYKAWLLYIRVINDPAHVVFTENLERWYPPRDFCTYWRAVLLWLPLRFLSTTAFLLSSILITIAMLSKFITAVPFLFILGLVILVVGVIGGIFAYADYRVSKRDYNSTKQPGFLKAIYLSYKKKYCPIIELEEK